MTFLWIFLGVLGFFALSVLLISYYCFREAFYVPRNKEVNTEEYVIPEGKIYEPFRDMMVAWMKETRELPYKEFSIKSFDDLTLYGKYYEYEKGAPIELMFHGYRGTAERDLCGGVQRCFTLGRSAFVVDQRTSGKSEGKVITFGINESKDCLDWIDFVIKHFGEDVQIIITGISMGAATVMMAAGNELPKNVISVLADCGYTSPKEIIKKVIKEDMHLPSDLAYPFVKLGARLYGHFDIDENSPYEAMKKCKLPIIFIHGEDDDYVPCEMSRRNFEVCTSPKVLLTVPGAGHGLSYIIDPDRYFETLIDFSKKNGLPIK